MKLEKTDIESIAQELSTIIRVNLELEAPDQLLNKSELAKKLRCDIRTVDELYICKPGFPKMVARSGAQPRFSSKAVDHYIKSVQIYQQ
jgi:hypothetical protein